ncbi:MAG: hypothetical protein FWD82_02295, partial [Defluviitaleaceae bacterium]|nr:hypothetical protein [Defluviitaleaceae bacterium]
MKKDNTFTDVLRFLSNRIFILTVLVGVLFYVLIARLFELQIVHGERFLHEFEASIEREVVLPAHRGTIYDAFGRPLAVNHFVYNLKLDPSILVSDAERNNMVYNLLEVLRQNEETFIDDFPISQHEPFEFTFTSDDEDIRQRRENRWKQDMGLRLDLTADEAFNALRSRFRLGEGSDFEHFSNTELRDMVAMRSRIFMTRYNRLTPITIAENVSLETVTAVVEDSNTFRSLVASTDALRYYPQGIYMAHILGYVGNVPAEHPDIPNLIELGFNINDYRIGRTGIEASFENNLRGTNGSESVLVSINGRRVESLPETRVEPAPGDSVFLTIDTALQQKTFRILEEMLTEILIFRLTSNTSDDRITPTELLSSFVRANNLSVRDIFESEIGSHSYALR